MSGRPAGAPRGHGETEPCSEPSPPAIQSLRERWSDLAPRIASAIVMIALALSTLFIGGVIFVAFWLAAGILVLWEWQRMVGGERPLLRLAIGVVALAAATAYVASPDGAALVITAGCLSLALAAGPGKRLWSAGGLVYAAALVFAVCLLRASIFDGYQAILWLFAVVWGTDVMAYFGGRVIGGRKLAPRISPSKTWAGFLTGVICGALIGLIVLDFVPPSGGLAESSVLPILGLGFVASAFAQGGDLFESAVKRHFRVKDASHLIPGHGGIMDRLDGFTIAAAFAALFGLLREGPAAAALGLFHW